MGDRLRKAMRENLTAEEECIKLMADTARRVFQFIKIRDSVKSKICKATTYLDENKYKDNLDMEAEYAKLKRLHETMFEVEMSLKKLRHGRCKMIEMQKRIKDRKIEMMRHVRDHRRLKTREILLTKKVVELKREVRQNEITSKIENDPFLKMAEDECIEILKCKLNVA